MPEYESNVTHPEIASTVSLNYARQRRAQGLKSANKITRTTQHTEGLLFRSSLEELFGTHELVDEFVGDPLLMSEAVTPEVTLARVQEEQYSDGRTQFSVVVSPEEYEWLTINLEFYDKQREIDKQIGLQLGRYYRLTQAVNYILETRGYARYENEALGTILEIDGMAIDFTPDEDDRGRKDIAKLRIAGGYVLSAMQLDSDKESDLRDYLQYSIEDRLSYTIKTLRFAAQRNWPIPPDLDTDLSNWTGVCLPLNIKEIDIVSKPLWQPDMNLI